MRWLVQFLQEFGNKNIFKHIHTFSARGRLQRGSAERVIYCTRESE